MHYAPSSLILSTFLIRSDTSQSSSYPIVLRRLIIIIIIIIINVHMIFILNRYSQVWRAQKFKISRFIQVSHKGSKVEYNLGMVTCMCLSVPILHLFTFGVCVYVCICRCVHSSVLQLCCIYLCFVHSSVREIV